jgi:hypothetical protein
MTRGEMGTSRAPWIVLLVGPIGAPLLWALHFGVGYGYTPAACAGWPAWVFHVFSVVVLLGFVASGVISYLVWRERITLRDPGSPEVYFLGLLGLISSVFFAAVVVAHGWATLFADPCLGLTAIP